MRVFHTGGMAGSDITSGLPRVQELVEARNPKGESLISEIAGTVTEIKDLGGRYEVTVKNDLDEKTYTTGYNARLRVKKGDVIENGAKITEGAVSPKKLLEVADPEKVEVLMLKEIQKVYAAQGIGISDKHIEVIVRQMLRKMYIIDAGDTTLLPGTRVSVERFTEANQKVLINGGRPAVGHPMILGITKAALETESFLSAASFQETTRVLTDAAIKAKSDPLHGLKENVITGKLIPAGTGLWSEEKAKERLENWSVLGKMKEVKSSYIEKHDRPEE
jgi:DNA-directed RNA polymerase subunit beta'